MLLLVRSWLYSGLLVDKNKSVYPHQEFTSLCRGKLLLKFCANYKIAVAAMATFRTSQCQDGIEVFKNVMN